MNAVATSGCNPSIGRTSFLGIGGLLICGALARLAGPDGG
jgi:hypothetical protein